MSHTRTSRPVREAGKAFDATIVDAGFTGLDGVHATRDGTPLSGHARDRTSGAGGTGYGKGENLASAGSPGRAA
ncbi:hypothetical protein [Streptomyces sp. NPDC052042]|uniref:hypothetical protein n=1 Tax=Streptomyces sp. NPDC052042 TaxID=3365683 RepID=UPI0037D8850F